MTEENGGNTAAAGQNYADVMQSKPQVIVHADGVNDDAAAMQKIMNGQATGILPNGKPLDSGHGTILIGKTIDIVSDARKKAFHTLQLKACGLEETFLSAGTDLILSDEDERYAIDACEQILAAITEIRSGA